MNTSLYHASIKNLRRQNRILSILNGDGQTVYHQEAISKVFLEFYQQHLGDKLQNRLRVNKKILQAGPLPTEKHKEILDADFETIDVEKAVFAIHDESPWPRWF